MYIMSTCNVLPIFDNSLKDSKQDDTYNIFLEPVNMQTEPKLSLRATETS